MLDHKPKEARVTKSLFPSSTCSIGHHGTMSRVSLERDPPLPRTPIQCYSTSPLEARSMKIVSSLKDNTWSKALQLTFFSSHSYLTPYNSWIIYLYMCVSHANTWPSNTLHLSFCSYFSLSSSSIHLKGPCLVLVIEWKLGGLIVFNVRYTGD